MITQDEVHTLLNDVRVFFRRPYITAAGKYPTVDDVCRLETNLFKYFLSKGINTVFVLYTDALLKQNNEMTLCISFEDYASFKLFEEKWGNFISDTSGFAKHTRKDNYGYFTIPLSITLCVNSLVSFGSLLEDELETAVINNSFNKL